MKPLLLDTFCKAGGSSMGYHRAGFEVIGVDIEPQKNYPFEFHQGDAIEFIAKRGKEFDAIHASPPCQAYSVSASLSNGNHPRLVEATRRAMKATGKPYIIENVPGAPLVNPITLCGTMFDLRLFRHRLFETSPTVWFGPYLCNHWSRINANGFCTIFGRGASAEKGGNKAAWQKASGIEWMTVEEMSQAIPPAYTEWLGKQMLKALGLKQARDERPEVG